MDNWASYSEGWIALYAERNQRIAELKERGIVNDGTWASGPPFPPEVQELEEWYGAAMEGLAAQFCYDGRSCRKEQMVGELEAEVERLREEVQHWKAGHDEQVRRKRVGQQKSKERIAELKEENERLRRAIGSVVWLLDNRHNKDAALWEEYARAAEEDLRAELGGRDGE